MTKSTYVVLDLETTGLDYTKEQITEIGAIKLNYKFEEIDRYHTLVSLEEGRELSEFITKLTGITAEDLEGKPTEEEALRGLAEYVKDSIVVAQNAPFDLSFISRGGIEPDTFICTRALARYVEPELSASLKDVTKRNGIKLDGHHRSMNDVEATIEVLKTYLYEIDHDIYDPYNVVLDEPSRPLKFTPKNAIVRTVSHVALDSEDLMQIFRELPKGEPITKKIGNILYRKMEGRA
ncbi:3'-5' exonuclease [Peribacillus frigoritolerans]|uniref:3'-5' exonuclease n=1 Tax=Peribacillus frigoritolerans TaxID=450367 RepID=UPI002E1C87D3|nr:3'-5' exonuclease [Peribacillus frigoritolerans]MED3845563.1 3'-5' exonuclease [Peribacillus frigoritolerans]